MYTEIINDDILLYTFFAIYYLTTLYIYIYIETKYCSQQKLSINENVKEYI